MLESVWTFWEEMPFTAKFFTVGLLVVAATSFVRYLVPLIRLSFHLRPLKRWLGGRAGQDPASKLRGRVRHAWKGFETEWGKSSVALDGDKRGMVTPDRYFRPDVLLPGIGRAIPRALPGIFAGIGILGTFLGIVLGLSGIDTGSADTLMSSVQGLLAGMSTAFISSIVGIALSVGWLILHRALAGHVESDLLGIRAGLEERFPVWDSAAVLRFSLETQQRQLEVGDEQKAILQNLGTDIAEAMETALAQTLNPALTELSASFTGLAGDIRGQQAEGMGELAKEFRKQLMETVQADFERLSESLGRAAEVQDRTATQLTTFMGELERVSMGQTELLRATSEAAERFAGSVDGLNEAHRSIEQSVPALTEVAEMTGKVLNDLTAQSELLGDANAALREALAEQLDSVEGQVRTLVEFWEGFSGSLGDFRDELQESIAEFRNMSAERLAEVFQQFDREMARVVEHLSGTLAELREVSEALPGGLEGLHRSVDELGEPLAEMASVLEVSRTALDGYGQHLQSLNAFLGDAEPLRANLSAVSKSTDMLVQTMGRLETTIAQDHLGSRPPASTSRSDAVARDGEGRA